MTQSTHDIYSIFNEAVGRQSAEDLESFLTEACGTDSEARQRVDALLRAHQAAGDFFGGAGADLESTLYLSADETLGELIGPYRLREVLGSGGMGVVYAAEQSAPIRRDVAIKVLKPGMDSREILLRFEAERQALALMEHPNIARVIDAGATDSGYPYFAMELVRGEPITDYCDRHQLPPRDRLKLFITVCQAVQHAHEKGIVHRDLKPSNVLVARHGDTAVPKVIDFGVAKALNQRLTEQTLYTMQSQWLGTPLYMSPEQVELGGRDLDARSDVYTLGVMLYELLTGATPLDREQFSQISYDELRRVIREDDPPLPSRRLSALPQGHQATIAEQRGAAIRELESTLRGDLDWITMKALEKDRARRYASAAALADDLQRRLDNQPVHAGPPSLLHRTGKLLQPHRLSILGFVLVVALVLLAVNGRSIFVSAVSSLASRSGTVSGAMRNESPKSVPPETTTVAATASKDAATGIAPDSQVVAADDPVAEPSVEATDSADRAIGDAATPASRIGGDAAPASGDSSIPPLAVLPFAERGSGAEGYGGKIGDYLVASLAGIPELIVVERAELATALDEQKLNLSGLVNPDESVQVGRLTGAKILVMGSILELDGALILSARITSTETGRIIAAKVDGKTSDDLSELAGQLAQEVFTMLSTRAGELAAKPVAHEDRLAAIKAAVGNRPLPKVWVQVTEEHVGQQTIDPAAETELVKLMEDAGFAVVDHKDGNRKQADVIVEGEAFSEFATRHNDLISVKARVEVKAVRRETGERIASDRQTEIVVDLAEQVAGKTALQTAAAEIATRLLPRIASAWAP